MCLHLSNLVSKWGSQILGFMGPYCAVAPNRFCRFYHFLRFVTSLEMCVLQKLERKELSGSQLHACLTLSHIDILCRLTVLGINVPHRILEGILSNIRCGYVSLIPSNIRCETFIPNKQKD